MKFKITYRPQQSLWLKKLISSSLAIGLIFNSTSASLASILLEDGRYEIFEGSNITINNILEEDKVDVEIEGNTIVNVANQKDPVPITKSYTVENTNHIPLQGEYDGKARPVIEGNTMYYNNDTGELTDTFVEGANLSLVSSFEDQLVTQEMVNNGEEKPENLGKYKVEYKVTGKNKIDGIWEIGHDVSGIETPDKNIAKSINFIKVQAGTTYTLSKSEDTPSNYRLERINFYKNGRYISHSWNETFKVPSDCNEIKVLICNTEGNNFNEIVLSDIPNFQLEEGSTATKYESYKESIKTFYLNSPLLEGDTIEDINGKATHVKRYDSVTFDGSDDENWELSNSNLDNCIRVRIKLSKKSAEVNNYNTISSHFTTPINDNYIGTPNSGYVNCELGHDITRYYAYIDNTIATDINTFKMYLNARPLTVIYQIESPEYETISEESILCDSYINGLLDLNTNIPVNKVDFLSTTTNLNYLYPSTEYTVQFESDNEGKIDKVLLGDELLYSNYAVNKGVNRFNITTPNNISSTELILDGVGFNLSNLVVTEAVEEDFDYFEGIKSVGQDDVNGHKIKIISNTNKIPKTTTLYKEYGIEINFTSHGIEENMYAHNLSNKKITVHTIKDGKYSREFPVYPNERIFIELNSGESIYCFAGLYEDGWNNNNTELLKKSIVLTRNENSLNEIEISLTEPLRSLPNGVKDRIIKRNGQWVVERNCGELSTEMLYNAKWNLHTKDNNSMDHFGAVFNNVNGKIVQDINLYSNVMASGYWSSQVPYTICTSSTIAFQIGINVEKGAYTEDRLKKYIKENNMRIVYQLATPIYESLNIDLSLNTYLDTTHISNNSIIPANMKVTIDRTINRATEAIELAKTNPTVANISQSRMWSNLLKETINKDALQDEINSITNIEDLQLERKTVTSNVDVYIKSENMLLMSLSTNSITFNDYSGVEDMELNNAINISINSSLPYQLNSYLLSEIENSDKTSKIEKDLLNIKVNNDSDYKTFNDINEKLILEDDCDAGNNKSHSIDLKLKGSQAYKADIYKTVIKFEAEQK